MKSIFNNTFFIFIALAILVAFFSPLASTYPDGLDWTVEQNNKSKTIETEKPSGGFLFADYKIPFIKNEAASTIFSAFIGFFIIMAFFKLFFKSAMRPTGQVLCEKSAMKNNQNAL